MKDKLSIMKEIYLIKEEILLLKIKSSMGENVNMNSRKHLRKKIARLFTKINSIDN